MCLFSIYVIVLFYITISPANADNSGSYRVVQSFPTLFQHELATPTPIQDEEISAQRELVL